MKTMYPAQVNSPGTELAGAIDAAQDTIQVADGSVLPDGPNLLTIGTDEAAETILYTGKTGDELTGVTRGFQGTAQSWAAGTKVARYFTAYDHDATVSNIGELSTGLKALGDAARDRLDIVERQDVVLNAGMQILNAQRRAAFSLSGIKGRTLVNLLGRSGNMNDLSKWSPFRVTPTLESGSAKLTIDNGQLNGGIISPVFSVKAGKHYIAITDIKNGTAIGGGRFYIENLTANKYENDVYSSDSFKTAWAAYAPTADVTNCNLVLVVDGAAAQYAYYDSVRIYEISAAEYTSLDGMTREQIGSKYPYVDSVQPVRNPYAIRYGENLLPPFYEWLSKDSYVTSTDLGLGKATITISNSGTGLYSLIKVKEGQSYAVSVGAISAGSRLRIGVNNGSSPTVGTFIADIHEGNKAQVITIPSGVTEIAVVFLNLADYSGGYPAAFSVESPMLTLGSTSKPFKPREDSMLGLQTDLYADPLTGANADEVFEKDGQYFKLAQWKNVKLDGTRAFSLGEIKVGFKTVLVNKAAVNGIVGGFNHQGIKYDGKILTPSFYQGVSSTPDNTWIDGNYNLVVSIANTDSGWGDNHSPTADEFKAYFMGWRMFQWGVGYDPYNGTGTKGWGKIYCGVGPNDGNGMVAGSGVSTLPTTMNEMGYTPYQLVYQLATPTVEPIVSEGMLTFNEGDNQIEVGTGIVVRESVIPSLDSNGVWNIGNPVANNSSKGFKYKAKSVEAIYNNSLRDNGWKYYVTSAYGALAQEIQSKMIYDPSAAYSATYLMMDKSPIVPFSGWYAANEKTMLQELTDAVQQNATAVNVLMQQKVEKDEPVVWITPTLLNGWSSVSGETLQYTKIGGRVQITGRVFGGNIAHGAVLFRLPTGYRPKRTVTIPVYYSTGSTSGTGEVVLGTDGSVLLYIGGSTYVDMANVSFIAEW
ncbi:hypothetical protein [Paenibacillus sp. FSL R5-808]|jgi:hypothetical protein|uniref:hypothetical protein n=1 Tax=Paenibacillus sp. FSL R5-808 TaxID=1227076 RepID=UPI0003E20D6E|nr:hypothetical protein [Paenibacillus sp. FSL R5-808]ETT33267.1 hypothetical protein C169_22765 [Paenibacillus sp. FSL R5-808]